MNNMAKGSAIFTGLLAVLALLFIIDCFDYETKARQVPLLVGIPTLFSALIVLWGEIFSPKLLKRLDVTVFDLGIDDSDRDEPARETSKVAGRIGVLNLFVAVVGYFVLVYLVGLLIASGIFVLLFLKVFNKTNWVLSILLTAVTLGFIYSVIDVFMKVDMFKGIIFGGIVPSI